MILDPDTEPASIVEASITDIQSLLASGQLTAVDLVGKLLHRISAYDCRGPRLNSIPILNPDVFAEAAASDARRARGQVLGPLEGIPYTAKDSYKVKGMTVAAGSPAFQDLVAQKDAFTIRKLREAGAILIGKTNMPPMAAGGMQRGVYGRAESPYNLNYLAAAFASGSSNGSAVATAANFATFGMAEETVSSGRSPASNNAIVAYTPSRGAISIRGNWPLYPTCDVVVPHTRSMDDLLVLLDVIAVRDRVKEGDFWREQTFVDLEDPWRSKTGSFRESVASETFRGIKIAVPEMYVGGKQLPGLPQVHTNAHVVALYRQAKKDLEDLGATVIEIPSFPLVQHYEDPESAPPGGPKLPSIWHGIERSVLIARAWESFLQTNNDPNCNSLADVYWQDIFPQVHSDDPQVRYAEPSNRIMYEKLLSLAAAGRSVMDVSGIAEACRVLEAMRKTYLEGWLELHGCDLLMFPAAGDVGMADADIDDQAAQHAWRNGVKYSNGNRALRHCGVPSVTVPMGNMENNGMPVGLTFAGRGGDDLKLLGLASIYEEASRRRTLPREAKTTTTYDLVRHPKIARELAAFETNCCKDAPELVIEKCDSFRRWQKNLIHVQINGYLTINMAKPDSDCAWQPHIEIFVDAVKVDVQKITLRRLNGTMAGLAVFDFSCLTSSASPRSVEQRDQVLSETKITRDSTMVVVLARIGAAGRPAGYLKLL